jgi:hypothetical protein
MLGRIAVCCLLAGLAGCAIVRPDVPTGALAERVLAPPRDGPEENSQSAHGTSNCPKALTAPPLQEIEPETLPAPAATGEALTLERAVDVALRNNPTLEALRERVAEVEGGRVAALADFFPESRALYRHMEGSPSSEPFVLPTLPTNYLGNVAFGGSADRFDLAELHVQWTLTDFSSAAG